MLKCLVKNCDVVVAPKTRNLSAQQKGALLRHLMGGKSTWAGRAGHSMSLREARSWVELSARKGAK